MARTDPSVRETLGYGFLVETPRDTLLSPGAASGPTDATASGPTRPAPIELDDTIDPAQMSGLGATVMAGGAPSSAGALVPSPTGQRAAAARSTVLPRRLKQGEAEVLLDEERPRFHHVRLLGEGAMGQIELARDNDIRRTVAVKRLRGEVRSTEAMLRFADEVRIVGQLEHPSIVPVYDVGRDEEGHVYLVMKHLQGETMERVIERLRAGDPAYLARYPVEHRVRLFVAILDAIRYAHARGILHRDLKPANIMIGPFGEVTVLDWGIAKPIRRDTPPAVTDGSTPSVEAHDSRLQETQFGALAGTPLYMSPEQAAGRNDELDERSDVYSLCVVLMEWVALRHPLRDKQTVPEVLAATISGLEESALLADMVDAGTPAEWIHVVRRGLRRDVKERFQSVDELEGALRNALDGRMAIQCPVTFGKRSLQATSHWIDRHPNLYMVALSLVVVFLLSSVSLGIYGATRLFH